MFQDGSDQSGTKGNGTILGARRLIKNAGRAGGRISSARGPPGEQKPRLKRTVARLLAGPGPIVPAAGGAKGPQGKSRTDSLASNDFAHFSLSFQSSFHLSLTVLVRYRSPANIQLSMDITTGLALQSQATRLTGGRPEVGRFGRDGALTLSGSLSQQRIAPDARGAACPGYNAAPERSRRGFSL